MPNTHRIASWMLATCLGCAAASTPAGSGVLSSGEPLALGAQTRSLFGTLLYAPPLSGAELAQRQAALFDALAAWERAPHDADATLWVGRRLGYLGRFREALEVFTIGAREHPLDPRFLRHRGHRHITLREFEAAALDLERAAELAAERPDEIEPDGQPNARGVPLESLKSNIYYHLGLAYFLSGEFERALPAWRSCLRFAGNPDNQCSATHWLYMTLRRLGRDAEAAEVVSTIRADFDIVDYHSYHQLCLAYRGEVDLERLWEQARARGSSSTDFATIGFGAGHWQLVEGHPARAREIFEQLCSSPSWHAFGRIAAEAELARLP